MPVHVSKPLTPWYHTSHLWHAQMRKSWSFHDRLELLLLSSAESCGSYETGVCLFSLRMPHGRSIRHRHHHSCSRGLSSWSSPSMKDHSSATTWRGARASLIGSARVSSQSHSTCGPHTARSQSVQGLVQAKISISTSWALTAYIKGAQYYTHAMRPIGTGQNKNTLPHPHPEDVVLGDAPRKFPSQGLS